MLAYSSPYRADAVLAAGGVPPFVRLMSSDNVHLHWSAALGLVHIVSFAGGDAAAAAAASAGAIPAAVHLLGSSSVASVEQAIKLLYLLASSSPGREQAIHRQAALPRSCAACSAAAMTQ